MDPVLMEVMKSLPKSIELVTLHPKLDYTTETIKVMSNTSDDGRHTVAPHLEIYPGGSYTSDEFISFTWKNKVFRVEIENTKLMVTTTSIFTSKKSFERFNTVEEAVAYIKKVSPAAKPIKKEKVVKKNDKEISKVKSLITRKTNDIEKMKKEIEKLQKMIEMSEKSLPELNAKLTNLEMTNE